MKHTLWIISFKVRFFYFLKIWFHFVFNNLKLSEWLKTRFVTINQNSGKWSGQVRSFFTELVSFFYPEEQVLTPTFVKRFIDGHSNQTVSEFSGRTIFLFSTVDNGRVRLSPSKWTSDDRPRRVQHPARRRSSGAAEVGKVAALANVCSASSTIR